MARPRPGHLRLVAVNEAFRRQRITGQQRYAVEIADRLERHTGVRPAEPGAVWGRSGLATWAWALGLLPLRTSSNVLLSLTSRHPAFHPRHVLVVHDLFVLTNPEWYSRKYVVTHAPLLRLALRRARHVIAVSEPVAEQLAASGLTRAAISVAPNAPSPRFTADAGGGDRAVLDSLNIEPQGYLLVVGSLDPRKNLTRLAAAYSRVDPRVRRSVPLVVVGGSHAIFGDAGVEWPAEAVMAGYVSDEDLAVLYANARGVVFPSLAEGFGLPIVEAAAAGARLAVSDIEVFRWIGGQQMRYFDPLSVDSILESLSVLIADSTPTDASFAASIRLRFDWDTSASIVLEACRSVART